MLTARDFWEAVQGAAKEVQSGAFVGKPEEAFRREVEQLLGEHFAQWGNHALFFLTHLSSVFGWHISGC